MIIETIYQKLAGTLTQEKMVKLFKKILAIFAKGTSSQVKSSLGIFQNLKGKNLTGARMIEMALIDEGPDGSPIFEHPAIPFTQASYIILEFGDSLAVEVANFESYDTGWGLSAKELQHSSIRRDIYREKNSIFRERDDISISTGKILKTSARLDSNLDISEVGISTESGSFVMKSGEVYEADGRTIHVKENDESVLLFLEPSKLESFEFGKKILF